MKPASSSSPPTFHTTRSFSPGPPLYNGSIISGHSSTSTCPKGKGRCTESHSWAQVSNLTVELESQGDIPRQLLEPQTPFMQILPRSDTFYAGRKKFEILHTWHLSSVLLTTPIFIAICRAAPEEKAHQRPRACGAHMLD